jgi:alanine-synthesizing transaminase
LKRYSKRLDWSTPNNSYSLLLEERRLAGGGLLDLTVTNPTEALTDYPHADIARAYGSIADFRYEADPRGLNSARQALETWYASQGIQTSASHIALTASTSEAYSLLFKLLCDPGDDILIPTPSYPLFEYLARAESVGTIPYVLRYDGSWFIDFDSVRNALSSRTKAIVVVNPNNPTGSYLKVEEVNRLMDLASSHHLALISDEVFMTYPAQLAGNAVRSLIGRDEVLSFSLNGLSKAFGMPQMKLGWMVINGPRKECQTALNHLELLLDNYLSVGTPVQRALPELLRIGSGIRNRLDTQLHQNRRALARLTDSPIKPLASEGGWSAILQVPNVRSEEDWIARLLTEYGVVIQPGYFYDMAQEAYLIVSLIGSPEQLRDGLEKLKVLAETC